MILTRFYSMHCLSIIIARSLRNKQSFRVIDIMVGEEELLKNQQCHWIPRLRLPFVQPFYDFKDLARGPFLDRENRVVDIPKPMVPLDSPTPIIYSDSLSDKMFF